MTDTQILTLALTVLAIFAGTWFNNSRFSDTNLRISDLSNKMDMRFNDLRDVIRAEMRLDRAESTHQLELMNHKFDALLQQLGSHETRINHLEER